MSRFAYFSRETFISLRRNLLMTIAGIITVMISLLLFGGILLVKKTVDHGTTRWKHGVELEIFMKVDSPQSEIDAMRGQLDANKAEVKSYRFLDHKAAYEEFKKIFKDQPALVETTTPDALPQSFRVVLVTAEQTQKVVTAVLAKYPKIDAITTDFGAALASSFGAFAQANRQIPAVATEDSNLLSCDRKKLLKTNPGFQLFTVDSQNWMVRTAVDFAVAKASGGQIPASTVVPQKAFEDSSTDHPHPPTCDSTLSGDAFLSSHLTHAQLHAVVGG